MTSLAKEIGVGLIGYGIGRVHAHAWKNVPLFYGNDVVPRLVGFCARDQGKTLEMKEDFDFEKSYSDWRDLVKDSWRANNRQLCTAGHPFRILDSRGGRLENL